MECFPPQISAGVSLGVLPDPAVVEDLGLSLIPRDEGGSSSAGVSASLGETVADPVAPLLKGGSSHNPEKGKQPRRGKDAPVAQEKDGAAYQAFILGEGLPPVPAKLVGKICRGEFVDMAELLRDNIEAERRRGSAGEASRSASQRRREIPDILSWVQCFGTYACVVASQHPEKLTQLLAYQTTVIREARRCGGTGWQGYDSMFRQHAANMGADTDWSKLNNSLYAVTFLAQQNGRGRTCEYCLESDHVAAECALAPSRPTEPQPPARQPQGRGCSLGGQSPEGQGRVATQLPLWEEEAEAPAGLQSTGSATPGTRASAGSSRGAGLSTSVQGAGETSGPQSAHRAHHLHQGRGSRWHGAAVDGRCGKLPRPWTMGQSPIVFVVLLAGG